MTPDYRKNWLEHHGHLVNVSCTNGIFLVHWEPAYNRGSRYTSTGITPVDSITDMYDQIKLALFNMIIYKT